MFWRTDVELLEEVNKALMAAEANVDRAVRANVPEEDIALLKHSYACL